MAVGFNSQVATLSKRVVEAKAALQAERDKAHKSAQVLKVATTLVFLKDDELERADQTRTAIETQLEITEWP